MKLLNTAICYTVSLALFCLLGCVTPDDIDTEKPHYSQGKLTIPFDVKEKETPALQPAP